MTQPNLPIMTFNFFISVVIFLSRFYYSLLSVLFLYGMGVWVDVDFLDVLLLLL